MQERDLVLIECARIESDRVTLLITDWSGFPHEVVLRRGDTATICGRATIFDEELFEA